MKVQTGAIKGVMASAVYSGPTGTEGSMMVMAEGKLSLSYCWQEIEKRRLQEMTKLLWLDRVTNTLMRQVRGIERLGKAQYNSVQVRKREEWMEVCTWQATYIWTYNASSTALYSWCSCIFNHCIVSLLKQFSGSPGYFSVRFYELQGAVIKDCCKMHVRVVHISYFYFLRKVHYKNPLFWVWCPCLY